MPASPAVTVLLPFFNAASFLEEAIQSTVNQHFENWELLLVNNASTDNGASLAAAWAEKDSRIRVLSEEKQGIVPALNTGLRAAAGKYIARMDADDEMHPERLAKQVAFLEANPHIAAVASAVEFGASFSGGYARYVEWTNSLLKPEEIATQCFIESPLAHPSITFHKKNIEKYGFYKEGDFPEDYELWLRWLDQGLQIAKLPEKLLRWNDPPERLSRTHPAYRTKVFYRLKAKYLALWLKKNKPELQGVHIWGAGKKTRNRANMLTQHGIKILGWIDIAPEKYTGVNAIHFKEITKEKYPFILSYVANWGARELIRERLVARGYSEGKDFLCAA